MDINNKFISLINDLDESQAKKFSIKELFRLIKKLEDKDINDYEIDKKFKKMEAHMVDFLKGDIKALRKYKKEYSSLKTYIMKTYKLVYKGYYYGLLLVFGVAIGTSLGSALSPAFYGVGIPIGIAIGAGIENSLERKIYYIKLDFSKTIIYTQCKNKERHEENYFTRFRWNPYRIGRRDYKISTVRARKNGKTRKKSR